MYKFSFGHTSSRQGSRRNARPSNRARREACDGSESKWIAQLWVHQGRYVPSVHPGLSTRILTEAVCGSISKTLPGVTEGIKKAMLLECLFSELNVPRPRLALLHARHPILQLRIHSGIQLRWARTISGMPRLKRPHSLTQTAVTETSLLQFLLVQPSQSSYASIQ